MMKARMRVGDFLVAYLQKIGVTHLFGIPGDLVINLFFKFGRPRGLEIVTLSHEPGIGFAADGYARATGRIGVVCVTYGAGGFNMVNPVAGSFSERVPILVVSGGPGEEERKLGQLIHHQAKEIESQYKVYDEITCAAAVLDDPRSIAGEVDRVVRAIWREQRPGYLEIHRDMVDRLIEVPAALRDWDGGLDFAHSDERKTAEAARETATRFNGSRKPAVIVGIETFRYKLQRDVVKLVERMGAPCMTTVLGKGAFPMDHPLAMGVHIGPLSPPPIRRRIDEADLVINLGTLLTDMNLGSRPPQITRDQSIWAVGNRVNVSCHTYTDVGIRDFVRALQRERLRRHREQVTYADNLKPARGPLTRAIMVADMLREVNRFLAGKRGWAVIAESGDMLFAGLDIRIGRGGAYLPGALGMEIGTGRRPIVLCGDGAFQMTGPELAQAPRHGLRPIVVLMNNGGWGIFRPIAEREDLLTIPNWPYAELARAWGGAGYVASTVAEFREALADAEHAPSFALIETRVDPHDLSPVSKKYIEASARKAGVGRRTAPVRKRVTIG
jgi:indolepyruvate decarboxylase